MKKFLIIYFLGASRMVTQIFNEIYIFHFIDRICAFLVCVDFLSLNFRFVFSFHSPLWLLNSTHFPTREYQVKLGPALVISVLLLIIVVDNL